MKFINHSYNKLLYCMCKVTIFQNESKRKRDVLELIEMIGGDKYVAVSMKGWLLKWTNYVKGYRRRWFVLEDENLSYYRQSTEADYTKRGTINLLNALIHTFDHSSFVIANNESNEVYYLKATNADERNVWVKALEHAKAKAIIKVEKQDVYLTFKDQLKEIVMTNNELFETHIDSLQKYDNLIMKYGNQLKKVFIELENTKQNDIIGLRNKIKETEVLFQISLNVMTNACISFLELAQVQYNKIHNWLWDQVKQRETLGVVVKKLIFNQLQLTNAIDNKDASTLKHIKTFALSVSKTHILVDHKTICCSSTEDLANTTANNAQAGFSSYKIEEGNEIPVNFSVAGNPMPNDVEMSSKSCFLDPPVGFKVRTKRVKSRRTTIPEKPNRPLNLWSVVKNCVGKDLSRIPMPVNFSEPLSFLQRITEDYSYSYLLDQAALCKDPYEQLAYLAAFAVSCYSTTADRTAKPFNPLLGETYEWDRTDDLGWRVISEQVSHHPPIAAQHCESLEWTCWQEFAIASKFRGKYLTITPLGMSHIVFHNSKNHYSWTKVTTIINNIIIGKLWVDNTGQMEVTNHCNSSKCKINFLPYSMFRADDQKKITGEVVDSNNEVKWIISGKWDAEIKITAVLGMSGKPDRPEYKTGEVKTVWKVVDPIQDSQKYYNFTLFACQLNEMEENIAPTDSRYRPDQRLMENGSWDEANVIKMELEEKQRQARKSTRGSTGTINERDDDVDERSAGRRTVSATTSRPSEEIRSHTSHEPTWFKTQIDVVTGKLTYVYKGGYWEAKESKNWIQCPNIYI